MTEEARSNPSQQPFATLLKTALAMLKAAAGKTTADIVVGPVNIDKTTVSRSWVEGAIPRKPDQLAQVVANITAAWETWVGEGMPNLVTAYADTCNLDHDAPAIAALRRKIDEQMVRARRVFQPGEEVGPRLHALASELESIKPEGEHDLFDTLFWQLIGPVPDQLRHYGEHRIDTSTHDLYQLITKQLGEVDEVAILDQNLLRWSEILDGATTIECNNTFEYSSLILDASIEAAKARPYKLRRLFVVSAESANSDAELIARILEEVQKRIDSNLLAEHSSIDNRVVVVRRNTVRAQQIKEIQDAVFLKTNDDVVMLQEHIDCFSRESTLGTTSSIVGNRELVRQSLARFDDLFKSTQTVADWLSERTPAPRDVSERKTKRAAP